MTARRPRSPGRPCRIRPRPRTPRPPGLRLRGANHAAGSAAGAGAPLDPGRSAAVAVENDQTMRRPSRLGVGLSLAVGAAVSVLAGTPAVLAASAAPHVSQTNWFWREQQSNVGGTGVAPPAPAPDPTVPAGDLAVAGPTNKQGADKESYVEFDLSAIPTGSTLTSFTVTVPLDPHAHQGFAPGRLPTVVACAVNTSWAGGDGAESFSGKPADDC